MIVIFGYGELGRKYRRIAEGNTDYVIYDNDRRKWGVDSVTLDELFDILRSPDVTIVNTVKEPSSNMFLKDVCNSWNKVVRYNGTKTIPLNLDDVVYSNDWETKYKQRREKCVTCMNRYANNGNEKAYHHAKEYLRFYDNNPQSPYINALELTNICNLACPNCPTPTCKRPKGYMTRECFEAVYRYIPPFDDELFALHGLGEPLLHPDFLSRLDDVIETGVGVLISTNGLLFNGELLNETMNALQKASRSMIYISFHSLRSVESWVEALKWIGDNKNNKVVLYGQVLDHNSEEAIGWLERYGITEPNTHPNIRFITSHSFAGNVSRRCKTYSNIETQNRIRNCFYIRNNITSVAWDGRLKSCCYDSELAENIGSVFDFDKARIFDKGYRACQHCDPDWTTHFQ